MDPLLSRLVLAIYYLVLGTLAVYGVHRLALVALYSRTRRRSNPSVSQAGHWPPVTVQLPIYNERYVVSRLIDAVCALD